MPAKGEKYNSVDVDLKKWCQNYIDKTGKRQTEVGQILGLNRARITDMLDGKINTVKYVELVVNLAERGNWLTMLKYATSDEGMQYLKDQQYRKRLNPYERELYDKAIERIRRLIDKGSHDELKALIGAKKARPKK